MAVLTGLSVLLGVGPVLYLINADIQAAGLGPALLMSALAGFLASIAGELSLCLGQRHMDRSQSETVIKTRNMPDTPAHQPLRVDVLVAPSPLYIYLSCCLLLFGSVSVCC
jgi:hypothetical protein